MKIGRTIIALVGMPGSGKSVAANFFKNHGLPILRFGDETDRGLKARGLPLTEENERKYREEIRKELGMAAMAVKIEPRITALDPSVGVVVLDGLYSWEEYLYLRDKFVSFILLCIYARPEIRYERLKVRHVRPLTPAEARSRDIAEVEQLHKGAPIALADYVIKNETTAEKFEQELQFFLEDYVGH